MKHSSFLIWLSVATLCTAHIALNGQTSILEDNIAGLHQSGVLFENHDNLFAALPELKSPQTALQRQSQRLRLNKEALHSIMSKRAGAVSISIPYNGENITVELYQESVVANDFTVKTGDWETQAYTAGVYYRGIIRGVPHSLAAISFFDGEVIGVLAHPEWGNLNLGRLDRPGDDGTAYALFNDNLLPPQPFADCVTREGDHPVQPQENLPENIAGCVRIFFEADYALFHDQGSVVNTVNYVTGVFNAVSAIYTNESISIAMSQIYVWTTPDAYSTTSSSVALDNFIAYRSSFDGDLAHLVALGGNNLGGIAYLNVLCSNTVNYGYSNIYTSFQSYPAYSWTVNVVAHELGHNFSSNHTHWCGWAGGAIDNCGPIAGYPFETPPTCSSAPTPPLHGGTIMSYCHLLVGTVEIDLANGFGPLPGNAIRSATTSALASNCIAANCPSYSCTAPTALTVSSITLNSASIGWNTIGGASSYKLQYRIASTSGWTTISGVTSPYVLTGLSAATVYEVQVQAVCGTNASAYATGELFLTLFSACPEPGNLTATTVTNTSVSLDWTENGTATSWDIEYGPAGFLPGSGTTIPVTAKPHLLSGLSAGFSYDYYVRATCGGVTGNSTWVGPSNFNTPFQNDLAANAIEIFVDAPCPGVNIYSNEGATTSVGEFSPSTSNGGYWNTGISNTVWFKFTAPSSGSVKVTTDINPLGTLGDTQIALYNTSSPSSATSHLLMSNEDGGTLGDTYATFGYYSGLTPGVTYYVQVDGWNTDVGTFCIEVQENFNLPNPTTCTSYTQSSVNGSTAPTKWFNIFSKPGSLNIGVPVAAVKSSVDLGTVTVQEIRNNTVPAATNGVKYMQRYYNFECTQNSSASKQIRLFYTDSELSFLKTATGQGSATMEDLNISHYDGINENCTPIGNGSSSHSVISAVAATGIGASGYFYLEFQSPSFSEMGAIFGLTPLPVELVSFTGNIEGSFNAIQWVTASEKDVEKFTIERSADGIGGWKNIYTQLPLSDIPGEHHYKCLDQQPFARTYYRLAIQDRDGSLQYSNIISMERVLADGIRNIAPNPAQDIIYIAYQSTQEQTIRFRIIGCDGRLVLDTSIDLVNGSNLLPFDISALPQGLYYCLTHGSDGAPFVKN